MVGAVRITLALRPTPTIEPKVASPSTIGDAPVDDYDSFDQQSMMLLGMTGMSEMDATTTTDHLALIGPMVASEILGTYARIRERGDNYTNEDLQAAGEKIAKHMKAIVAYDAFENDDFTTGDDTTSAGVRVYRDNLVAALKPIDAIGSAEYVIYGHYMETSDPKYLKQLQDASAAYRAATDAASKITVPRDAVNYHRDLLNSLRAFGSVLDGLVTHGEDPFASAALLRTYTEKEQQIADAYNRMRAYYAKKEI